MGDAGLVVLNDVAKTELSGASENSVEIVKQLRTVITSLKVHNFLISAYDSSCNYFSLNYFLSTIDGIPSCLGDGP